MLGLPLAFTSPWLLLALISLPVIWWLLRSTPPRPQQEIFPPTRILSKLFKDEETPAQSPWWLTLLRLTMAALIILAMAGPILNPQDSNADGEGPVMMIVDDGWSAAQDWQSRLDTALAIVSDARRDGRPVLLSSSTGRQTWPEEPVAPREAQSLLQASEPRPFVPSHSEIAGRFAAVMQTSQPGNIVWLSDGLQHSGTGILVETIESSGIEASLYLPDISGIVAIQSVRNEPSELHGEVVRPDQQGPLTVTVVARDAEGLSLARSEVAFAAGETRGRFTFPQPVELRNQITKLEIELVPNAGAVQLLDENNKRRLVGLLSGEKLDLSQPLLSPLNYISKALEPFSDLRNSDSTNTAVSVPDLLNQGISTLVLADVGVLGEEVASALEDWVEKGGLLIRFAGPRLATAKEARLLPVEIRPGDRNLGGALSWETPKPLAPFETGSPYFGIEPPRDVIIKKQVLALQEADLEKKTWATLVDGTPLVTADKRGAGWIVLFHVGSDANWSNLPISGTFVEMLRRTVSLSRSTGITSQDEQEAALPPLRVLDGYGAFTAPDPTVKPLQLASGTRLRVTPENPPGFYGTEDGYTALNLYEEAADLPRLSLGLSSSAFTQKNYLLGSPLELKNWLLSAAVLLFLLDCVIVMWMSGVLGRTFRRARSVSASLAVLLLLPAVYLQDLPPAGAQETDFSSALRTRLAYVITNIEEVDRISEAGMRGLTYFISDRTALEPGEPIGLDIARDELAFYSLIYWPVDPRASIPDAATMARVDAYMKQGGSILFDTRDQLSGLTGGTASSPAARALQQILSGLDIPPLEPVPTDHVLTKAFYLLDDFPGRYAGGELWVEALPDSPVEDGRPARGGDGVSSILITSNDLIGAWAVDTSLRPILPTVPPDPVQRNHAFRAGVNLMMYALTGNYKADQVHLPALLERLGQ